MTGCLPFQSKPGREQLLDEMLRQVRDEDPPRPSTKVGTDRETSSTRAEARGTEPKQLVSLLRGDLDWITMKAIERDRNRRYTSAAELVSDVRRYLRNEPVTARPASVPYRMRKYVRRHRIAVTVATGLVVLLAAFAVTEAIQLRRITRERDRADRIAEFMTGIFKASDPNERLGGTVTAAQLLDKAAKDIDTGLAKDPELQTSLMHVIGRAYMYQGLFARAQSIFEAGIKASSLIGQPESREALLTMHDLAWALLQQGRIGERKVLSENW